MFEQIPVAPGSSPGLQIKYQPWKMLGLDSVAWILPVFSLLPLELECKHPVKSDAFSTCACCVVIDGQQALLCSWSHQAGTEKCHEEELTGTE